MEAYVRTAAGVFIGKKGRDEDATELLERRSEVAVRNARGLQDMHPEDRDEKGRLATRTVPEVIPLLLLRRE
jgi:hypothetical protein